MGGYPENYWGEGQLSDIRFLHKKFIWPWPLHMVCLQILPFYRIYHLKLEKLMKHPVPYCTMMSL